MISSIYSKLKSPHAYDGSLLNFVSRDDCENTNLSTISKLTIYFPISLPLHIDVHGMPFTNHFLYWNFSKSLYNVQHLETLSTSSQERNLSKILNVEYVASILCTLILRSVNAKLSLRSSAEQLQQIQSHFTSVNLCSTNMRYIEYNGYIVRITLCKFSKWRVFPTLLKFAGMKIKDMSI